MISTVVSGSAESSSKSTPSSSEMKTDQVQDDESSDDEPEVRMRVGDSYQANVPDWNENEKKPHSKEGMLIWTPNDNLQDDDLDKFCTTALEKYQYNTEQALGMLFWHKHDIKTSLSDMVNFTPMPDEWSLEDKVLFEQAFAFHGKNFRKIQQLVPDKEIGQLVKHYYTWKKTRIKTSVMDKQASKKTTTDKNNGNTENKPGMLNGNKDASNTEKMEVDKEKPSSSPKAINNQDIPIDIRDIEEINNHAKGAEGFLSQMEENLVTLKRQVQIFKQECGLLSESQGIAQCPISPEKPEVPSEWTDEEKEIAKEAFRTLGDDFIEVSEILGTKTVVQVKDMYQSCKGELFNKKQQEETKDETKSEEGETEEKDEAMMVD